MNIPATTDLPPKVLASLQQESGTDCTIPRCKDSATHVVPINGDSRDRTVSNLLPICSRHRFLLLTNKLEIGLCSTIKYLLNQRRFLSNRESTRILQSRDEYITEIIKHVSLSPHDFRLTYVGPLFLHPNWYFDTVTQKTRAESMDRIIQQNLQSVTHGTGLRRIILRNSMRYLIKLRNAVQPEQIDKLKSAMLENLDWLVDAEKNGVQFVCSDPGYARIPFVFETAVIMAERTSQDAPISSAVVQLDSTSISNERDHFDRLFESQNASNAASQLMKFIRDL